MGPVAFVVHINNHPETINDDLKLRLLCEREIEDYVVIDDFRRQNRLIIPYLMVEKTTLERVTCFKLFGLWIDDNLKWNTNTEYIVKKAAKRLYLLNVLKSYLAPDLNAFYTSVIRSVLEYGAHVWHGGLTGEQCQDIERIQRRALRIIYPEMTYDEALFWCGIKTLGSRRAIIMYKSG